MNGNASPSADSTPSGTAPSAIATDGAAAFARLVGIMERLRDPVTGCRWDRNQTFATIAPYTIEEAYEVADAIAREDWADLCDELGDLLLQVVYHAQIARERGLFTVVDVAQAIANKLVRRHPQVFGEEKRADAPPPDWEWEQQKAAERAARVMSGALAGVPMALPALSRAAALSRRAARVGFDWPDASAILDKLAEETKELQDEISAGAPSDRLAEEVGDTLFVLANLARKLGLDPESCLRAANMKFERRFSSMEQLLASEGRTPLDATLAEMERLWAEVKRQETKETGDQATRTTGP